MRQTRSQPCRSILHQRLRHPVECGTFPQDIFSQTIPRPDNSSSLLIWCRSSPPPPPLCASLHCVPKKHVTTFFYNKSKQNCEFTKIFGRLITKSIGHRQVFLFSHLAYLVQLLYLGKLSRPKYQQKLNKIMKISQEDVILIKKTSICQSSMVHEGS